jgi:hypothetical protein
MERRRCLFLALLVATTGSNAVAALVPPPKLSEVRLDSLPPLVNVEYIELMGVAGYPLDGLSIVVLGDDDDRLGPQLGNSGVVESVIALDGRAVPTDRALLIHASGVLLVEPDLVADLHLEDADNLTVLLVRDAKLFAGDDLDLDDDGKLDVEPWSDVLDGVSFVWGGEGTSSEWTYAPVRVGPAGGVFIFAARRCLDTDAWVMGATSYIAGSPSETAGRANPPCAGVLCVGDINQDGLRDAADLSILLLNWDKLGTTADLDGDGVVAAGDLSLLLQSWGACDL